MQPDPMMDRIMNMDDTRTTEQRTRDMALYGPCVNCGAARTVKQTPHPHGSAHLALACPAGCDQEIPDLELEP
jgi:hypothetical protein